MKASQIHSTARLTSAGASTNATNIKNVPGDLQNIEVYNSTASVKYLKFYNKASAPVVGTDTPFLTFAIPPNGRLDKDFSSGGIYFSVGISYATTGANTDGDTTALTAGDLVGLNIIYS